jgi:hypothetical protein
MTTRYLVSSFLRFTASDFSFGILWSLCCLPFLDLRLLITPLVSCGHCVVYLFSIYGFKLSLWYLVVIVLSTFPRFTASDYSFGILWSLCCLPFLDLLLLITPKVDNTMTPITSDHNSLTTNRPWHMTLDIQVHYVTVVWLYVIFISRICAVF